MVGSSHVSGWLNAAYLLVDCILIASQNAIATQELHCMYSDAITIMHVHTGVLILVVKAATQLYYRSDEYVDFYVNILRFPFSKHVYISAYH